MAYKDDLMADKDGEDVVDIEGDTEYEKEVVDEENFDDPNSNDEPVKEAEGIEKEDNIQDLAKHSLGEEVYNEPEES